MWLDEDQDKVHAWLRQRREICPRCGTVEADWIDPATKHWRADPKWEATTFRCPGCAELERVAGDVPGQEKGIRVVFLPYDEDRGLDEDEEVNHAL